MPKAAVRLTQNASITIKLAIIPSPRSSLLEMRQRPPSQLLGLLGFPSSRLTSYIRVLVSSNTPYNTPALTPTPTPNQTPSQTTNPMEDIARLLQSINLYRLFLVLQKITAALNGKTTQPRIIIALFSCAMDTASLLRPK